MIDFTKVNIIANDQYWLMQLQENPLLEFKTVVSKKTGELENKEEAKYRDMKFIIYDSGTILLEGSLHKYWNYGKHNFNDFTFKDLVEVINDLKNKFDLNIKSCILRNIEVGVNIIPPINTNKVLNGLLVHAKEKFKDMYIPYGNCKQVVHERYKLKAYDKKIQYRKEYNIPNDLLRFEIHYSKMFDLKNIGVITLEDLINKDKVKYLGDKLLKAWNEILLFDKTIIKKRINKYQRETKLNQWENPYYWMELNKQRRNEQKKSYNSVLEKHSQQTHKLIHQLISNKFDFLLYNSLPSNQDYIETQSLPFNSSIIGLHGNNIPPIINKHYL